MPDTQTLADAVVQNLFQTLGLWAAIIIVLCIGLYLLLKFYLIPKEINKKTEKIKSTLAKERFIHRLQFEKEFSIYEKLWGKLVNLENESRHYIILSSINDHKKDLDEDQKQILKKSNRALNEVWKTIKESKPFYSAQVFKYTNEFLDKTHSIVMSSKLNIIEKESQKYFEELEKYNEEIIKIIDNIESAIRERIRNIGEAKLIE